MSDTTKIDYNFHTHTARCGHAYGKDGEYVEQAIAHGFSDLGFSDHAMFPFLRQPGMRGDYSEVPDYINSVRLLQEKFASKIKIFLGFETEWLDEGHRSYYEEMYRMGIDYFILGHHMLFSKDKAEFFAFLPIEEAVETYAKQVVEAIESGYFLYVAHPDFYMSWHRLPFSGKMEEAARKIIAASIEHDIPLEVNMVPSRRHQYVDYGKERGFAYPCPPFWELASKMGAKCTVGVDAHMPSDLSTGSDFSYFEHFVESEGLKVVRKEELEERIAKLKKAHGSPFHAPARD